MIENVIHLPEGRCVVQLPEALSDESANDFGDWLGLVLRTVQRAACVPVESLTPAAATPTLPEEILAQRNGRVVQRASVEPAQALREEWDFENVRDFIASRDDEPQTLTEIEEGTGIGRHRLTTIIYQTHRKMFFGTDFPGKQETAWALASVPAGEGA